MPYGNKDSAMKMKGSWMSKHIQNLFKEMPIDNKASALEMDKGSALYTFEGGLHAKNTKHSKDGEHLGKK